MKKTMFNDRYGLTEAVLSGRKTQTRRIIKFSPIDANYVYDKGWSIGGYVASEITNHYSRYKVGEIIAVVQSYKDAGVNFIPCEDDEFGCYGFPTEQTHGWTNKMFVRADLMPHRIRITNVRVERLQDISDEDCIKEGVELNPRQYEYDGQKVYFVRNLGHWRSFGCYNFNTPREAYAALIDKISGKGTWESNPYVFVYDFELVK